MADIAARGAATATGDSRSSLHKLMQRKSTIAFLMALPLLILIFTLVAYPAGYAVYLATLNKGMTRFVGFGNFDFLFGRETFWMVVYQSCLFAITGDGEQAGLVDHHPEGFAAEQEVEVPEADEPGHALVERRQIDGVARRIGHEGEDQNEERQRHQEGDGRLALHQLVQAAAAVACSRCCASGGNVCHRKLPAFAVFLSLSAPGGRPCTMASAELVVAAVARLRASCA